jgi:hypothetical protein
MEVKEGTINSGDASEDRDVQEIMRLEQERAVLLVKHDFDAISLLVPENFTMKRPSGVTLDKGEVMAALKSGELLYEALRRECHKVVVYQNTAAATGLDTLKGMFRGERVDGQYRFRNTYVQTEGRWELVAAVSTRIRK